MPQIFVFTARKPKAQRNLKISIGSSIDENLVFTSFGYAQRADLRRIQEEGNGFYAWGAVPGVRNIPNWMAMERGDYVLCMYDKTYHYVARVLASTTMRGLQDASGARTKKARPGSICTS